MAPGASLGAPMACPRYISEQSAWVQEIFGHGMLSFPAHDARQIPATQALGLKSSLLISDEPPFTVMYIVCDC